MEPQMHLYTVNIVDAQKHAKFYAMYGLHKTIPRLSHHFALYTMLVHKAVETTSTSMTALHTHVFPRKNQWRASSNKLNHHNILLLS